MNFNVYATDFFDRELKQLAKSISDKELDRLLELAGIIE